MFLTLAAGEHGNILVGNHIPGYVRVQVVRQTPQAGATDNAYLRPNLSLGLDEDSDLLDLLIRQYPIVGL